MAARRRALQTGLPPPQRFGSKRAEPLLLGGNSHGNARAISPRIIRVGGGMHHGAFSSIPTASPAPGRAFLCCAFIWPLLFLALETFITFIATSFLSSIARTEAQVSSLSFFMPAFPAAGCTANGPISGKQKASKKGPPKRR